MSFFATRFEAVDYPHAATFSVSNPAEVAKLVFWLEENRIKHFKNDLTKPLAKRLKSASNADELGKALDEYLKEMGYTRASNDLADQLEWLLSAALVNEYQVNGESYNLEAEGALSEAELVAGSEALSKAVQGASANDPAIQALLGTLGLPPHPDPHVTLATLLKVVRAKYTPAALPGASAASSAALQTLEALPLGFETADPQVAAAAKILRLLFIADLRELQNTINQLIVAVQNTTAAPKTDPSLGRVGK